MSFADSNRASLRFIPETLWAQTPASGESREMRIKTSKLAYKKETKTSEEIRSDRMIPSIIEVAASSDGDIDFEFSAGAIDPFLEAFVYGKFTRPMTMDFWEGNVSITANNVVAINSSVDYSSYLTVGRRIKLEGFKNLSNNGYFQISAIAFASGKTSVTVVGTPLTVEGVSNFTKLFDANDVLVMNNTSIRFGTAGASTIDSAGSNAFASAIAAGQIKSGQKVHVDGLGFEAGTITFSAAAALGDTITINDTRAQITLEAGQVSVGGNIEFNAGADEVATGAAVAAAIVKAYTEGKINVVASAVAGVVTVTNLEKVGGTIATSGSAAIVDFTGGEDTLRGVFTIVSASDDVLEVSPTPATNANAGGKKITIKGSMLRNPSRASEFVSQSFTVETGYEDVSQYFVAKGLRVGTFDLDAKSKEICSGKIALKGEGMERRITKTSKLGAAPYTSKLSTPGQVMSATTNVGSITKDGQPLVTALQSISISGDAALREQNAVGHKFAVGIGAGRFKLTGKFAAYFESGELFDDFVSHNTVNLSWFFRDLDNQRYDITLPAIKLTGDPLSPGGIDQDVIENIDWEAQRDPATNCMIQFDRFSSVKAPSASV